MKRSPLQRRSPMPRSRSRTARTSPERFQAYQNARETVHARCGARCECCGRRLAFEQMHAHHRRPRSAGRDDSPANLLALCGRCHDHVHLGPGEARLLGRILTRSDRHADAAAVPVFLFVSGRLGWWALTAAGERVPLANHDPTV